MLDFFPLDSDEEVVADRRVWSKLTSLMENLSNELHHTGGGMSSNSRQRKKRKIKTQVNDSYRMS